MHINAMRIKAKKKRPGSKPGLIGGCGVVTTMLQITQRASGVPVGARARSYPKPFGRWTSTVVAQWSS
jgi:hypothetical protein